MSPTQRALAFCKKNGWTAAIVERWNPYARVRQDLLGFADLVVLDGQGGGVLAVQVTSGSNHAARRTKTMAEPRAASWLAAPARIEVWSYSKRGVRGKRKLWELRRERITTSLGSAEPGEARLGRHG